MPYVKHDELGALRLTGTPITSDIYSPISPTVEPIAQPEPVSQVEVPTGAGVTVPVKISTTVQPPPAPAARVSAVEPTPVVVAPPVVGAPAPQVITIRQAAPAPAAAGGPSGWVTFALAVASFLALAGWGKRKKR